MNRAFFKAGKKINQVKWLWLVVVCLVLLLIGTLLYTMTIDGMLKSHMQVEYQNQQRILYEQQIRDYCYDRSIVPCDKGHIWQWESNHPDDEKVTFRTEGQITNSIYPSKF